MNTLTINLSTSTTETGSATYTHLQDEVIIKGQTKVTFNLIGINEAVYNVSHLKIIFGDGSSDIIANRPLFYNYKTETIFNELLYGKINSICNTYDHTYTPTNSAYYTQVVTQIVLFYDNYNYGIFVIPFKIMQASYYDNIDRLQLLSTQLLPISSSPVITNLLQTKDNQTVVAILSNNS